MRQNEKREKSHGSRNEKALEENRKLITIIIIILLTKMKRDYFIDLEMSIQSIIPEESSRVCTVT